MHRLLFLAAAFLAFSGFAGAPPARAQESPGEALGLNLPEITMVASDFAFEISGEATAGPTLISLENTGAEPHHAQLMQLAEGRTFADVETALGQAPDAIFGVGQFVGGPTTVESDAKSQVVLDLAAGQYVALCFIESSDGLPHLAKGMVQAFEIGEATGETATMPDADLSVVMTDFAFDLPDEVAAGPQIWAVVNEGPQPHEIALLKLADGVTPEQVMGMMAGPPPSPEAEGEEPNSPAAGPPPFTAAGGMQALTTSLTGWAVLDLAPGTYMAVCFVPDPETGQPHVALGMIDSFTVA